MNVASVQRALCFSISVHLCPSAANTSFLNRQESRHQDIKTQTVPTLRKNNASDKTNPISSRPRASNSLPLNHINVAPKNRPLPNSAPICHPKKMTSRRAFLALAALPSLLKAAARGSTLAPALSRYADLATDLPVTRLTDPAVSSILPPASATPLSRRGNFLIYASDASGRFEAYRMDLKKGEARQLSEADQLHPASLTLLPNENSFCYFDGDRLMNSSLSLPRATQIYKSSEGFEPAGPLHVSTDGLYAAFVEKRARTHRLRLVNLRTSITTTLAEADEEISDPISRPKRASVLYRRGGGLYLANYDGKQNYRLRIAGVDAVLQAMWSPDGRTVLYLNSPSSPGKLNTLREFVPDSNDDRAIAGTTQFAAFGRNGDASVFVGAGGSKASPYVLLLVRAVKRELTLCEHRASNPAMVAPMFSPNSQQVFFNSDLHGKPAIYRIDVEKLVEATA
jgi:oligogalacturonide lyase